MHVRGVDTVTAKDPQSVTPLGIRIAPVIEGVEFRSATTQIDDRGTLTEILTVGEDSIDVPIVHVYQATVRPGQVKGWVVHLRQDDRLFFLKGAAKIGLFDGRVGSTTEGMVDVRYIGDENRGLLVIPAGVYHAVRNIGSDDVAFLNLPTRAYDHEDPDKHRVPLDTELIPHAI
jgi:dTDP-4-dehydrorhamnose 3,5-epimerase